MFKKIGIGIVFVVLVWVAVFYWSSTHVIGRVAMDDKLVALTFDDGPNPPYTESLLVLLAEQKVKATFFLKGANVEAFPNSVLAVAKAGHEIGNHSFYHKPMAALSKTDYVEEITRTNNALEKVLAYAPKLFRPPYGVQGLGLTRALNELDMRSIGLGANGSDWSEKNPQTIASAIVESVEPGGFILLHDGHADVDDPHSQDSREPSIAAAKLVIESLRKKGYRFVTVGEMLAHAEKNNGQ